MGTTTDTKGHRQFRAWWREQEKIARAENKPRPKRAAFARRLGLGTGQAVSGWLRGVSRPERALWPAIEAICGIAPANWLTKGEVAQSKTVDAIVQATGTDQG